MSKKTRFLSMVLALMMIVPMLGAFAVVGEAAAVPYDSAAVGDLLYTANFNGDDVWSPAKNDWGSMNTSISSDGSTATFSSTTAYKNGWGGELSGFTVGNRSYTIVFTATSVYNEGMHIGISLNRDGSRGYLLVTPGRDRYALGWYNSYQSKKAFDSYDHSQTAGGNIPRTYAIEVAADGDGNATKYTLYVQDGSDWVEFYDMTDFSNFNWSSGSSLLSLDFVKYLAGSKGTNAVDDYNNGSDRKSSVSNVKIYKGIGLTSGGAYYTAQNGDKLEDVIFSSDVDDYICLDVLYSGTAAGSSTYDDIPVTVADDGKSITFTTNSTGAKRSVFGHANSYPLSSGSKYTLYFTADIGTGMRMGFYHDTQHGLAFWEDSSNTRYMSWSSEQTGHTDSNLNYKNKTDFGSSVKEFAIEIDYNAGTLSLYGRNQNGLYSLINQAYNVSFDSDTLYTAFWVGNKSGAASGSKVTISNVSIYKGLTVETYDDVEFGLVAYNAAAKRSLLRTVDFDEAGWNPGFASSSNNGANVAISDGGNTVQFTVLTSSSSRAMWGARPVNPLPLAGGVEYTYLFDLTFGNTNVGFGLQLDGDNFLLIGGDGSTRLYNWNTAGTSGSNWLNQTDIPSNGKQTFALEVDYANRKYNLFVKDSGGGFHSVSSLTVPDWTDTPFTNLLLDVRKIGGTANSTYTATVSNMRIYKGLNLASGGYLIPYSDMSDGALIKDVNFTETDDFAPAVIDNDGYDDITATLSNGGSTLTLKGASDGNHRGIWKAAFAPQLPLTSGVQYTFYFHLQMDSNMRFAFFPDGQQGMAIVQNNTYCGYQEWASLTTDTQMNWGNKTDAGTNLQDFAIELDNDAGLMKLYGQNLNGTYSLINSIEISSWNSNVLMCAFYAGNTSGKKVVISDFSIYKGLTVETLDRSAIGFDDYDEAADGALLKAVNFSEAGWNPQFADDNNKGADVAILNGGNSVQFTIQNANNRRAMWGNDFPNTKLPMHGDANYFFTFDLTFGNENAAFAIYPDNNNGLLIAGDGRVEWWEWNNSKVGTTYRWTEDQFSDGKEAVGETHSFAVKMNYASRSFTLYIKKADGTYALVASKTYSGAWSGSTTMKMRLYVRSMNNTADGTYTVKVDSLKIYKGLFYAANINKGLIYDPESNGYDFVDVDFNDLDGVVYDSDSYNDVVPEVSADGKSVTLSMKKSDSDNYDYGRAFWGNVISPSLPLTQGVVYTFVYTVDFGDPEMLVGIYADTSNGIVVKGDGSLYLMDWNNVRTTFGTHWDGKTDVEGMTQTFAIIMDYTAKEFSVYIKKSNATFAYVTGTTMKEGRNWDRVDQMECQIFVKYSDYNAMDDAERENYKVTLSNLSIYKGDSFPKQNVLEMVNGAQTRTATDTTGLRFTSRIGKTLLDGLVAQYGDKNVKVGMLITPTDYVNAVGGVFTKAALEATYGSYIVDYNDNPTKYPKGTANGYPYIRVQLPTTLFGTDATVDTSDPYAYIIRFAIVNLAATNQNREFSSTVYIEVLDNNHNPIQTYYSTYAPEDSSRSVAYVSALALNDVSATKVNEYKYSYNGGYSPYTENQRTVLSGFSTPYTVSVMQYNVEMYSTSSSNPGWEDGRDPTDAMNTIRNNAPDIVTLDEINDTQPSSTYDSNLRKSTYRWGYYEKMLTDNGYTRVQGDTSQDMWEDIFYKTDRYTKGTSGKQKFKDYYSKVTNSESADTSLDDKYRSWTYAYLTDKHTGQKLLVIATHLHYGGTGAGHEADDTLRRYEIAILNYWVGTQKSSDYDYIILAGDMNSDYRSGSGKAAINLYKNFGYALTNEEAAVVKEVSEDFETTLAVNGHSELSQYVFDYIMTIGNVDTIYYEAIDNPSANGVYPSDHLPIMAKMVLNK